MSNLTLAIPAELKQRMKRHSEIRWSEVIRKAIAEKIEDLEVMERMARKSRLTEKDAEEISRKVDEEVARKAGLR